MSIDTNLDTLRESLSDSYDILEDRFISTPEKHNLANLAQSIRTLHHIQWGLFTYIDLSGSPKTIELTEAEFNSLCNTSGAQPALWTVNIRGENIPANNFRAITIGMGVTSIPERFLSGAQYMESVDLSKANNLQSIGNYCFTGMERTFNSPIVFPDKLTTIGHSFLYRAVKFNQPLNFNNVVSIGDSFLLNGYAFDQSVTFTDKLTSLGLNFLDFTSMATSSVDFTYYNVKSGQDIVIPDSFMVSVKYNKPLVLPAQLKRIGTNFMYGWNLFNQTLIIPDTVVEIGNGFLAQVNKFNSPITLPTNATMGDILGLCIEMCNTIDVKNCPPPSRTQYTLTARNASRPSYTTGITIKGANRAAWLAALPNSDSSPYRKLIDGGE